MEEETYVSIYQGEEIQHKYYKNKIDLNKEDINRVERKKLLYDYGVYVLFEAGTIHSYALENILSRHGYNPKAESELNSIFDEEFPNIKEEIYDVRGKYKKLEEENEILKKYKDTNKDYLTQEERDTIQKIEDDIYLKRGIEEHNLVIEKLQRIEANIDKLGPRAEQQYFSKHKAQKSASVMSVLATLLSIDYAVIATILIFRYGEVGSFIGECFNSTTSDIIMKGIGVIVILIFIVLLFSMYVGCINLMSKWSESIGIFALVAGVLGILYGPAIVLMAITRHNAEWELGYSDPSMSDVEVFNEYEKLKAARRINRKR